MATLSPDEAQRNPGSGACTAWNRGSSIPDQGAGDERPRLRDPGFRCASSGLRQA